MRVLVICFFIFQFANFPINYLRQVNCNISLKILYRFFFWKIKAGFKNRYINNFDCIQKTPCKFKRII